MELTLEERKKAKLINVGNDYYVEKMELLEKELESGELIDIYVSCIGHTHNNMTQEMYKSKLLEKYGDKLEVSDKYGWNSYSYYYRLKNEG